MPSLGTKLSNGLPRDLIDALPEDVSKRLLAANSPEELKSVLENNSLQEAVEANLSEVRTAFGDDWAVMHGVLQGNRFLVAGVVVEPLLRPRREITENITRLPSDLDERISHRYDEIVATGTWSFNPKRWFKNWLHRREDNLNVTLGKFPDLLGNFMKFVDVLPQIQNDPKAVMDHLRDYFPTDDIRLPWYLRLGLRITKSAESEKNVNFIVNRIIQSVYIMAARYIAGATIAHAKPRLHQMTKSGIGVIADPLGEAVKTEDEAVHYLNRAKDMVTEMGIDKKLIGNMHRNWEKIEKKAQVPLFDQAHRYDFQLAVKLSSFYSQWNVADPEGTALVVKERLRELLRHIQTTERSEKVKIGLTIDLEQYQYRNLTYKIFKEVMDEEEFRRMERVGVVVQTYLKDAPQIIHDLAAWSKKRQDAGYGKSIQVRPVKGAYVDYEILQKEQKGYPLAVVGSKEQADINFQDCIDLLIAYKDYLRLSVASHNDQSYLEAIEKAIYNNCPFELQMLLGMQDARKEQLFKRGIPIFAYTPIGEILPGMAYLARRFLENASQGNFLFMVAAKVVDKVKILLNPRRHPRPLIDRTIARETPSADLNHPYRREPLTDFANEDNQEAVRAVLSQMDAAWWQKFETKMAAASFDDAQLNVNAAAELAMASLDLPFHLDEDDGYVDGNTEITLPTNTDHLQVDAENPDLPWDEIPDNQALRDLKSLYFNPREAGKNSVPWPTVLESFNPAHPSEKLGEVKYPLNDTEVALIVHRAHSGFLQWSRESLDTRVARLRNVAQMMRDEIVELTALIMRECGKSLKEADADIAEAIDFIEYYTRQALIMQNENPNRELKAKGVAAIVAPWNFPLAILTGMTVAALVTGNSVVMKPSEETPLIAQKLLQLLRAAGINHNAIQMLAGDYRVGEALLKQKDVKLVAFTGSKKAGLDIFKTKMPEGVEVIAEMGGKNALIVDFDAHPDDVINAVLNGKFGFAGQKCSAIDRLIIVGTQKQYEAIRDRLIEAVKALKVGDPQDFGNFMGPVIRQKDKERLLALLGSIGEKKGKILYDGRKHDVPTNGHYVGPSIVETDDYDGELWQEEFFGPLLAMTRASTLEEAVEIAQNSKYGLTGGYIGRSPARIRYVLDNWEIGNLYINREESGTVGAVVGENSFGGLGLSGINGSKAGGSKYLWQFVEPEWIGGQRLNFDEYHSSLAKVIHQVKFKPAEWDPLYSPKGSSPGTISIRNTVNYYPRGKGLIVAESQHLKNVAELVAAADLAGVEYEVVVVDAHHPLGDGVKSQSMQYNARIGKFFEVSYTPMAWADAIKKMMDVGNKWVAFANEAISFEAFKRAAAQVFPNQDFVRSVHTFRDPSAETEKLVSMLFEPRTVTVNESRHGFVPPEKEVSPKETPKARSGSAAVVATAAVLSLTPTVEQDFRLTPVFESQRLELKANTVELNPITGIDGLNVLSNVATGVPVMPVLGVQTFIKI